jgi:sporadic carbohydrate cluster protein (TIGR04323 family)
VKNRIAYTSYEFENEHMDWQPGLEWYIKERPDGIVLCSMYCLTDDVQRRLEILNLALDLGVELHFANELVSLKSRADLDKIETYLNFAVAKSGPHVWEI